VFETLDLDDQDELQVGRANLAAQGPACVERPRGVLSVDEVSVLKGTPLRSSRIAAA